MKKGKTQTIIVKYLDPTLTVIGEKWNIQFSGFSDKKPGILQTWQMPFAEKALAAKELKNLVQQWSKKQSLIIFYV